MVLFDVNIYVYAHREDSDFHREAKQYLQHAFSTQQFVGFSPLALAGFIRVVTHPKVFLEPTSLDTAVAFCEAIIENSSSGPILHGRSSWAIFSHLIQTAGGKGNVIPDAWFAALAIEHDCTWVTTDRDYSRFPGLKVEYPLGS